MIGARALSLVFAAGAIGGLANSGLVWWFGRAGISQALGVAVAPSLTPAWLYPRIVWGGLWGFLFLFPSSHARWIRQGLLLSLGPSLVQLLVVFPLKAHQGVFGLELGLVTPLLVVLFNGVWGLTASGWLRLSRP